MYSTNRKEKALALPHNVSNGLPFRSDPLRVGTPDTNIIPMDANMAGNVFVGAYNWAAGLPVFIQIPIGLGLFLLTVVLLIAGVFALSMTQNFWDGLVFRELEARVAYESALERLGKCPETSRLLRRQLLALFIQFVGAIGGVLLFILLLSGVANLIG